MGRLECLLPGDFIANQPEEEEEEEGDDEVTSSLSSFISTFKKGRLTPSLVATLGSDVLPPRVAVYGGVFKHPTFPYHTTLLGAQRREHTPGVGDIVVGVVVRRLSEFYRVDINAAQPATLPVLAFNNATKRHAPRLEASTCVLAAVVRVDPHVGSELSCVAVDDLKSWSSGEAQLGPLYGGYSIEIPIAQARSLQTVPCFVLDRLGQQLKFEVAVGANGRVWVKAEDPRATVVVAAVIKNSYGLTLAQVDRLVNALVVKAAT